MGYLESFEDRNEYYNRSKDYKRATVRHFRTRMHVTLKKSWNDD